MSRVFVTLPLPSPGIDMLRERFEVTMMEAEGMPPEALKRHIAETDPMGIIGIGRIGQAMARRGLGFNMSILYSDARRASPEVESQLRAQYLPLDELLRKADYVSIHADLNDQTRHLIGERELKLMGPEHYLINAARGPIVDEKALVRALKEGWIKGAGLDVYEHEPQTEPGLTGCWNAVS